MYGHLAELRSLLLPNTPYMACTTTITKSVRKEVVESLEMSECVFVSVSPNRPNIYYEVHMRTEIETDFADLLSSLSTELVSCSSSNCVLSLS